MSRDYARTTAKSRPRSQTTRRRNNSKTGGKPGGLFWFVSGVAVGALLTSLILVPGATPDFSTAESGEEAGQDTGAANRKPRFDFYKRLSENEVVVIDEEEPAVAAGSSNRQPTAEPVERSIYLLQAGSFKNAGDADSLRAQLLLMNLNTNIENAKTAAGDRWYRVMVGPFDNRTTMTKARSRLASNGIETLALKRKQ